MFDFRGKRILVADDDEVSAKALVRDLEAAGAKVIGPATRVDEARAYLHSGECDGAVVVVDLDGAVTTPLVVLLSHRQVPTVVAMENTDTYPSFAVTLPRCKKPLDLQTLALALDESTGRIADLPRKKKPAGGFEVEFFKMPVPPPMESNTSVLAHKTNADGVPVIELDASPWRNELDLNFAMRDALKSIEARGGPDAWGTLPYVIRIIGTADCRAGLLAEINRTAELFRQIRARALRDSGRDMELSIEVVP